MLSRTLMCLLADLFPIAGYDRGLCPSSFGLLHGGALDKGMNNRR